MAIFLWMVAEMLSGGPKITARGEGSQETCAAKRGFWISVGTTATIEHAA